MAGEKITYDNTPESQAQAEEDLKSRKTEPARRAESILKNYPGAKVHSWVVGGWGELDENGRHRYDRDTVKIINTEFTEEDLDQLLVRKATPRKVYPSRRAKPTGRDQLTVAAGDAQFPFADARAIALFHAAIREIQPDNVVLLGDMIDLPSMSKYKQRPEWIGKTNEAIEMYSEFLAQTRANAPDAKITVVHGNHEQRLIDYTARNAMELMGLRRAGQKLAALSIQNLAAYDDYEIEYVDGYPNDTIWITDNLKAVHGVNVKKGGFNVGKYLQEERDSIIFGHTHRVELANRTWPTRDGAGHNVVAASPGALCMTDGTVPGVHYSPTAEGGLALKAEDWQQGILLIDSTPTSHDVTTHQMHKDRGIKVDGRWYNVDVESQLASLE